DAPLPRAGDEIIEQVQMVVGDQVAVRVGGLPVAPEGEPQPVPAHAGELRHVFVDHLLAIGTQIAGGAVVGGGGKHVVRAEEAYLLLVVSPAHHALAVEVDRPGGALGRERGREQDRQAERCAHGGSIDRSGRARGSPAAQWSRPERSPECAHLRSLAALYRRDRRAGYAVCTSR